MKCEVEVFLCVGRFDGARGGSFFCVRGAVLWGKAGGGYTEEYFGGREDSLGGREVE